MDWHRYLADSVPDDGAAALGRLSLEEGKDFALANMLRDEKTLREMPAFELESWAVNAIGGIPNRVKVGDYRIDGKLYPVDRAKVKSDEKGLFGDIDTYYPIR